MSSSDSQRPSDLREFFRNFELPLFYRELLESANRKRTYVLRVITALIVVIVFGTLYLEMTWYSSSPVRFMGKGIDLAVAIFVTDLVAIFVLLPAMACTAISLEREKQTLSLLLTSRLSPGQIVLEKLLSRIMPIIVLLIASAPVLGITYVCGGFGLEQAILMIVVLLVAAIQVASTAIFCSSFSRTALGAFWATYIVLAGMMLLPIAAQESNLLPFIPFKFLSSGPEEQLGYMFVVYLISVNDFMYQNVNYESLAWCTAPPLLMSAFLLILSRLILIGIGTGEGFNLRRFNRIAMEQVRFFWTSVKSIVRGRPGSQRSILDAEPRGSETGSENGSETGTLRETGTVRVRHESCQVPEYGSIGWRERRSSAISGWKLYLFLTPILIFAEFWLYIDWNGARNEWVGTEIAVLTEVIWSILGLLLVMSLGCRIFPGEKERQTLDSVLVIPISNRELLRQKCRGINIAILMVLCIELVAMGIHLMIGRFSVPPIMQWGEYGVSTSNNGVVYFRNDRAWFLSLSWFLAVIPYIWGTLLTLWVYLELCKWISIGMGLWLKSQMKAMVASILTVLAICFIPMLTCLLFMVLTDNDPDSFPLFCFTSPIFIYGFNLADELNIVYRSVWWPDSPTFSLVLNLFIYGGLALGVRLLVVSEFSRLIERRD